MENTGDLQKEMKVLDAVLPEKLKDNLHDAYKAYLVISEKEDDEKAENIIEQCDDIFYENEDEVNEMIILIRDSFIPAFKILTETLLEKLDEAESDRR